MRSLTGNEWSVRVHEDVRQQLDRLKTSGNTHVAERIRNRLHRLETDPLRPRPRMDIRPLSGADESVYRLRVGDWRVIYEVDHDERVVYVTTVAHRSGAYG